MSKFTRAFFVLGVLFFIINLTGCSEKQTSPAPDIDVPVTWKIISEGKWGIRLKVPLTMLEEEHGNFWIYSNSDLKLIVNFRKPPTSDQLKKKLNYKSTIIYQNGIEALLCSYEESSKINTGSMKKVIALYFLMNRSGLGSPYEPSYKVEYSDDSNRDTAMRILKTVEFYDSWRGD